MKCRQQEARARGVKPHIRRRTEPALTGPIRGKKPRRWVVERTNSWHKNFRALRSDVKTGTRTLGHCPMIRRIAALRIIARSAPSPSSPAPSARRYSARGLTARRGRAIRRPFHKCTFVMLAEIDFKRSSDNDRWVEYWFSQISDGSANVPDRLLRAVSHALACSSHRRSPNGLR
jgi:transposase